MRKPQKNLRWKVITDLHLDAWFLPHIMDIFSLFLGFPGDSAGKESLCSAGDLGLSPGLGTSPGIGNIPWRRERLPTPVFWPGEFHGLYTVHGVAVRHDWATCSSLHVSLFWSFSRSLNYSKSWKEPWFLEDMLKDCLKAKIALL